MSIGLDVFDATVQQTNLWLKDLMERLGVDRKHAYKVLSATLHAVRDRIGPDNAVHLGAQLPMLMRGFYYRDGTPQAHPPKSATSRTSSITSAATCSEDLASTLRRQSGRCSR